MRYAIVSLFLVTACATPAKNEINNNQPPDPTSDVSVASEGQCDLEKHLFTGYYPGLDTEKADVKVSTEEFCAGYSWVYFNQDTVDYVDNLNHEQLQEEVLRVVKGYINLLPMVKGNAWTVATAIGDAMCLPYYNDGWGRTVSPPVMRRVWVSFVTDPMGELGGPGYPALLLGRAAKLQAEQPLRMLNALFERYGPFLNARVPGNCGYALNHAYKVTFSSLLRDDDIEGARRWATDFRWMLAQQFMETHMEQYGVTASGNIEGLVKDEAMRRLAANNVDGSQRLLEAFEIDTSILDTFAKKRVRQLYEREFKQGNSTSDPAELASLKKRFDLSEDFIHDARIAGYADAGYSLLDRRTGPLTRGSFYDALDERLDELPHQSRVLVSNWMLRRYAGVSHKDLQAIHGFMKKAEVTTPEVSQSLLIVSAYNANTLYWQYAEERDGHPPEKKHSYVLALDYAMNTMEFDFVGQIDESVCDHRHDRYSDYIGAWFMKCANGEEYLRQYVD